MGLDIYLYKCHVESVEKLRQIDNDIEKIENDLWEDGREYESYSESEKESIRSKSKELVAAYVEEHAVPVFQAGSETYSYDTRGEEKIEIDSSLHPEHMFKIGYFRSSYNAGGLESRARNLNLPSLHDVFDAGDEYSFKPDWEASLARAKAARDKWSAEAKRMKGFDVFVEKGNPFSPSPITSQRDALDAVLKAAEKWGSESGGFDSYSNGQGSFFKTGIQVHAMFVGTTEVLGRTVPAVYVATKSEKGGIDWYVDAWDVVVETCEYVLSQDEPEKFFFHWSG